MLAVELINRAYILSGIVPRDLEDVSGSEGADGLFWLNQLLTVKAIQGSLIPYLNYISMPTVVGQEIYFIPDLVRLDTITFNIGVVRYSMIRDNENHYFGSPRVDNILALPFHFYSERVNGGTNVYLYFLPQAIYTLKIKGVYGLSQVTMDTDMSLTFDNFYQMYLMYELAYQLCDWFKLTMPQQTQMTLNALRGSTVDLNPMDLTMHKIASMSNEQTITYAQANIGKGWTRA